MRNLICYLILACVIGCTSNRYYVKKDGRQMVILDEDHPAAYVTDYEEIRRLPYPGQLQYVGTKDGYHIVRWSVKIPPDPSAAVAFAVPQDQFAPARPFKFEGAKSYGQGQLLFDR